MGKRIDLSGSRFGRLTVLGFVGVCNSASVWKCRCDCGVIKDVSGNRLRSGKTRSCGCLRKEGLTSHGGSCSALYWTWIGMMKRCYNPSHHAYNAYGGRGVTVCQRWHNLQIFINDMGPKPKDMTLDRIDNSKGYSPENCRWATPKQQARNRRRNVVLRFDGKEMCMAEWATHLGISRGTLFYRLKSGWPLDRALRPLNVA